MLLLLLSRKLSLLKSLSLSWLVQPLGTIILSLNIPTEKIDPRLTALVLLEFMKDIKPTKSVLMSLENVSSVITTTIDPQGRIGLLIFPLKPLGICESLFLVVSLPFMFISLNPTYSWLLFSSLLFALLFLCVLVVLLLVLILNVLWMNCTQRMLLLLLI